MGGTILAPDAVIAMPGMGELTCESVNELGVANDLPSDVCVFVQGTAIAVGACLCSGGLTPEPTMVPTPNPTPGE